MDENKQIEERIELENIISDAIRDYEDYCEDCYESGDYRVFDYEESIADSILSAGYRKQIEGEWVKHELWEHDYICSVCGKYAPEDDYHDCCIRTDYCPNCGARMKGE